MDDAVIAFAAVYARSRCGKAKINTDQRWARMMAHTIFSDVELVDALDYLVDSVQKKYLIAGCQGAVFKAMELA